MNKVLTKADKAMLMVIYALIAVIFLSPLLATDRLYYPYITLKNFSFRLAVELMVFPFFILLLRKKVTVPKLTWPFVSVLVFAIIIFFANLFGHDPSKSFWGNLERMDAFVTLVHLITYVLIVSSVLKTKRHWGILAHFSLALAFWVGIIGWMQLSSDPKVLISSTFGNSTYLAIYMVFHLFLVMFLLEKSGQRSKKISACYVVLFIFFLVTFYNTGSRGSFLGFFAGLFSFILFSDFLKTRGQLKAFFTAGVLLFALTGTFLWVSRDTGFVQNSHTLSRLVNVSESSKTRFSVWKIALEGIKEHPWLGWGQENFNYVFDRYYDPSLGDQEPWYDRAHNVVLDWTVAGGLLGGLAYLTIFIVSLGHLWKRSSSDVLFSTEKALLSGVLVAYFVHNLFIFDHLVSYILFFTLIAFIVCHKNLDQQVKTSLAANKWATAFVILLTVYMSYNIFNVSLPGLKTASAITEALSLSNLGKNEDAFFKIRDAVRMDSFASHEAIDQMAFIAFSISKDLTLDEGKRSHFLNAILIDLRDNAYTMPQTLTRMYIYLALSAQLNHPRLEDIFRQSLEVSPKRQIMYSTMIQYYLGYKKYKEAQAMSKAEFDLDHTVLESRIHYAFTSIYTGDISLSDELIRGLPLKRYINDQRFITAYSTVNRKDKIIDMLKRAIAQEPSNPDYYLRLGMIHQEMGLKEEAEASFKKSREITQKILLE